MSTNLSLIDYVKEVGLIMQEVEAEFNEKGELTAELEEKMSKALLDTSSKVDRVCSYLRHSEGQIEYLKAEKKAIDGMIKAYESKIKLIERAVTYALQISGSNELEGAIGNKLKKRYSKSVEIVNENEVPGAFLRTKVEIDKVSAKAAMVNGKEIPGLMLKENVNISWNK